MNYKEIKLELQQIEGTFIFQYVSDIHIVHDKVLGICLARLYKEKDFENIPPAWRQENTLLYLNDIEKIFSIKMRQIKW